ncbi:AAA family ATPase [Sinorhizobium meliloti]|uniref:ATP-binding protein n=1 Tax=Rhizobium meliloti TaxID=382 RepID=UPI00299D278C|nr:AAA family ATPase [Sinorhizobium meliloti]MDW9662840.1 AAA family ATPase [Sinorhizobium meliloti]MDX0052171.1 AAA family ATPase [Sinorhizobium meliloti]
MRLKAVSLQNFRRYRERTVVPIDQLTAFIGRNDAGKSTILEALDIFFEGGTVRPDPGDASIDGEKANVRIGAVFTDLPVALDLDAGAQTTLAAEHLLNVDGHLEIVKTYNCSVSGKVPAPKISARAMHPTAEGVAGLLQKKNSDLKKLVKGAGVEANCHQNSNPSMRQALYNAADNLALADTEVPLNDADAKNVWEAIKRNLPVFVLFQSDRASRAQDPEVQNPMKLAVQKALAGISDELEAVSKKVQAMAEETAKRTVEQMQGAYPEMELASVLKPAFEKPNWSSVFKLDLESDDGIPLNKRGSGVRRLVLLSFFQAEALRVREERASGGGNGVPIIYAIEEPETSQHPDHQERIISAFREVAGGGDQVILTTHVPALAGLLPVDSLRFVDTDPADGAPRVRAGSTEVFAEVAATLGVLPDAAHQANVRVAVAVEGPTDVDALISLAGVLMAAGDIDGFDQSRVFWTMGGGSTLKDWVERRYLDSLNIPQIFIFDSDQTTGAIPPSQEKVERVAEINARPNCQAFLSRKRTIENYMDVAAVMRISENKIQISANVDPDYGDMADAFAAALKMARAAHGQDLNFYPEDMEGRPLPLAKSKKIITAYIMRNMTANEVRCRGTYTDVNGESRNEILQWLTTIRAHL